MPFLVLLILGLLIWRYSHRIIQTKKQDQLILEARVCVLEREVQILKEKLETRQDRVRQVKFIGNGG